jgi:hypothetical protein
MAVINLTEARIRGLPLGSGIHRNEQVRGLMVICHRTTKTYAVQGNARLQPDVSEHPLGRNEVEKTRRNRPVPLRPVEGSIDVKDVFVHS